MRKPQPHLARMFVVAVASARIAVAPLFAQDEDSPNRFTVGARLQFNISAKFQNAGSGLGLPRPPAVGSPLDRVYDDGYVGVDADKNAGGITWYWGYQNASQVTGDGNLSFHSSSVGSASSRASADSPQPGLEVAWMRELKRFEHAKLGFKLAFNYADLSISDSRAMSVQFSQVTDTYALSGIVPPGDPTRPGWQYQATRDQGLFTTAPVINDIPASRNESSSTALVTGTRTIDANIFGWKLGPWIEIPLGKRFFANASAGVSWALVDSEFRYSETTTFPGGALSFHRGVKSDQGALVGPYAEVNLNFALAKHLDLFVGGEFEHFESFSQRSGNHTASIDFGESWSLLTGLRFSF